MFNWFFHLINKISTTNNLTDLNKTAKSKNRNVNKSYTPISADEYEKAEKEYKKEIDKLLSIWQDPNVKALIDHLALELHSNELQNSNKKKSGLPTYEQLLNSMGRNVSLQNFWSVAKYLGEDLNTWKSVLLSHILSKSKFKKMIEEHKEVPPEALVSYARGRLHKTDDNADFLKEYTDEEGAVTQLFDNATRNARIIVNYRMQNDIPLAEDVPTDDTRDENADRQQQAVLVDKQTPEEQLVQQENAENVNRTVKKILSNVKEKYPGYPQLYYALYSFLKNFLIDKNKTEVVRKVQLPDYVTNLLKDNNIIADETKEEQKSQTEFYKDIIDNSVNKETLNVYKGRMTVEDCENVIKLLRATKDIYAFLLKFVRAESMHSIPYNTLIELGDRLDSIKESNNAFANMALENLHYNEIKDIINRLNIKNTEAKTTPTQDDVDAAVSQKLKQKDISKAVRTIKYKIDHISKPLKKIKAEKQQEAGFKLLANMDVAQNAIINKINEEFETKTGDEEKKKQSAYVQEVRAIVSDAKREISNVLLNDMDTDALSESTQNLLFAKTLLESDKEYVLNVIENIKKYSNYLSRFDKNSGKRSAYDELVDRYSKNSDVSDVFKNPLSFFQKPTHVQNEIYQLFIEDILPVFKDIAVDYLPDTEVTQNPDDVSGNQPITIDDSNKTQRLISDFYDVTGVYYDFDRDEAFRPNIIAQEVFSDGKFVPLILNKLNEKESLQKELNRVNSKNIRKQPLSVYSFDLGDVVKAIQYTHDVNGNNVIEYHMVRDEFVSHDKLSGELLINPYVVFDTDKRVFLVVGFSPDNPTDTKALFFGYEYDPETSTVSTSKQRLGNNIRIDTLENVFSGDVDIDAVVEEKINQKKDPHTEISEDETKPQSEETEPTNVETVQEPQSEETEPTNVETGYEPTEEENMEATKAGWNFTGLKVTAEFFKFAVSEDNYGEFNTSREDKEQGLIEGFEFNEENTEDSLVDEKKEDEEFSLERLGKVLSTIKDESPEKWQEIQQLVKQSTPKAGDDLLLYLNLWAANDWNAEAALRAYNEQAVEPRDRSYFWGMFKRNVWPQISKNPSIVNAVNKLAKDEPVEKSDVETVEYK